jgi:protein-tyrosine-phosphatase
MGKSEGQLKRVLVVCTGNTCRSPMAAGWLNHKLAGKGWVAESAGVAAWGGSSASPEAVEAMREVGVDLGAHESRPLSRELVEGAQYVLAMTTGHLREIEMRFPEAMGKVRLLDSFGPEGAREVPDPFGLPLEAYRHTRDELARALGDFLVHLAERGELDVSAP